MLFFFSLNQSGQNLVRFFLSCAVLECIYTVGRGQFGLSCHVKRHGKIVPLNAYFVYACTNFAIYKIFYLECGISIYRWKTLLLLQNSECVVSHNFFLYCMLISYITVHSTFGTMTISPNLLQMAKKSRFFFHQCNVVLHQM